MTWSGTHLDDNEQLGHPATGRAAEWASAVFYRVECGQITEFWSLDDHLGKYQDLEVITEEELRSAEGLATPTP